jgi:hypothetical protein
MKLEEIKSSDKMTSTAVCWIAKGHWDRYYSTRLYPRTVNLWGTSGVFALFFLLFWIFSAESSSVYTHVSLLMLLLSGLFAILAVREQTKAKNDYVDYCITRWEQGDPTLPDFKSVIDYTNENCRKKVKNNKE